VTHHAVGGTCGRNDDRFGLDGQPIPSVEPPYSDPTSSVVMNRGSVIRQQCPMSQVVKSLRGARTPSNRLSLPLVPRSILNVSQTHRAAVRIQLTDLISALINNRREAITIRAVPMIAQ